MSGKKGGLGSSFEDFLKEQGSYGETTAIAVKRVLARQLAQAAPDDGTSGATAPSC